MAKCLYLEVNKSRVKLVKSAVVDLDGYQHFLLILMELVKLESEIKYCYASRNMKNKHVTGEYNPKATMTHENFSIILYFSFDGVMGFDQVAIPDSNFSHKHAKMATYMGEPIVVGSCWGLEVEQLKTSQEIIAWNQLESFPNPEKVSSRLKPRGLELRRWQFLILRFICK